MHGSATEAHFSPKLVGTQGLSVLHLPPLVTWATPRISLSKTNHSKRLLLLQTCWRREQTFSSPRVRHPLCHCKTTPTWDCFCSGRPAGTLCLPGLGDHAHLGPCGITSQWDLLFQTRSTGAFPALGEWMTLSTNEGQGWQSQ